MAASWLEFWNGSHRIYVNEQHRTVHYAKIAADIIAHIPAPDAIVVDWGCGDATEAATVAARAGQLILCDAASATRDRVAARFAGKPNIHVVAPDVLSRDYPGKVDLFIVNSVLQYLSASELDQLLVDARRLLSPTGSLIIADVIPTHDDVIGDIRNLLGTAAANGFLLAAAFGLAATFFSPYRRLRSIVGLSRHDEAEFLERLRRAGFAAERLRPNLGFDQRRMAFRARSVEKTPSGRQNATEAVAHVQDT